MFLGFSLFTEVGSRKSSPQRLSLIRAVAGHSHRTCCAVSLSSMHSLHVSSWHLPNLCMWWFSPQCPVSMPETVFSSDFVRVRSISDLFPDQGTAWIVNFEARDQNDHFSFCSSILLALFCIWSH
jgi:hypothetical protein